ncbi:Phytanoyl-CoA dioxygenase (PhyH) [Streptomyces sp. ADI96-02]|uniref:phytanoyl-CoA dioxygenase family protein n=1 Tax=unclassified Streptomyces TaxID=2593676 RepID=UPI000F54EDC5|nr:phytanoyl-CoA dioxygenase family protein [Streptomyces sp. ADI96-02]RPK68812.1 Phytanoyl-CoA dioxygenase (PhyH) [Streptomyces sp. ADI96-02]
MIGCTDLEIQVKNFPERGFLVLPGFLPGTLVDRLMPEVDRWVDTGLRKLSIEACSLSEDATPPAVELEMAAHAELAAYPPLLELLADESLLGPSFVFHHLHSDRRPPGGAGKSWHHDYEQRPQRDRELPMVHALHYIGGLRPGMGSLAVLPGSHLRVAEKDEMSALGTARQPGEEVVDDLPRGSTVLLHSALFHTRRAARGPSGTGPRYMVDASYCRTGAPWPPVKPYWRAVLAVGRTLEPARGRWPELFSDRHFSPYAPSARRPSA